MSFARLIYVCAVMLLGGAGMASAGPDETDLARRRYETGKWLYQHGRLAEALVEFKAARQVSTRPELDYNIGLCEDQLGRRAEAAEAYRRFVEARPDDPGAVEVRGRIAVLDAQLLEAGPRHPRRRRLALGLGVAGLALGAGGIALGSVVLAQRSDAALYDRNRAMAITTDVLLPLGGALALSGLVVYLVDRRERRTTP
jgi:tetratricopeptide (TPR) repeat protein